ncbi:MAG: pirin family protein [Nanoarchaeota archaeon]
MIEIIRSEQRGKSKLDWLDSKHTFSFGRYNNPERINFGKLIVFNDDIVKPGKGFGAHPHENAEIISLVLKGKLKHEDSKGNKGILNEGELQRISAGSGVWHSEFNASNTEEVHFLQIWIEPNKLNVSPSYEQKSIKNFEHNKLNLVVSGEDKKDIIQINQDASIFLGKFDEGKEIEYKIKNKRKVYLFVIGGKLIVNDNFIEMGDSALISDISLLNIRFNSNSEVMLIEVGN